MLGHGLPLAGLHVQAGLLGGLLDLAGLLALFHGHIGHYLGSAITCSQVGSLDMFPGSAQPLVGFCDWTGLWAGLHSHSWLGGVPDQMVALAGFFLGRATGRALWLDLASCCDL